MIYGYVRILKYHEDVYNLDTQKEWILKEYPDALIIEENRDAKNNEKQKTLLENMVPGDMIVCTKLSRFCSNLQEGLQLMEQLIEKGFSIHFLDMEIIDNTETGRFIIQQLYAHEECKRSLIKEQCEIGKEKARKNPAFKEGRPPKYTKEQLDEAVALRANHTFKQIVEMTGISENTIRRYKKKLDAGYEKMN